MTEAVIKRVESLAVGQPSQPVFTDQKGLPIGDVALEFEHYDNNEADVDLPGVHLPEPAKSAEIPGVDSNDQDLDVPDLVDANDVVIDFDSQAKYQDNDHTDNVTPDPMVPGVGDTLESISKSEKDAGVRRSTRERKQVTQYKPSMTGKKYAFAAMALATTELGQSYLYDDSYQC
jgi:hypothetical protein